MGSPRALKLIVYTGMNFAKHQKFRLNQQCDPVPLDPVYCLKIKRSRKENGSMSKGLAWIQVLADTDKFHNMLLLETAGEGGRKAGE